MNKLIAISLLLIMLIGLIACDEPKRSVSDQVSQEQNRQEENAQNDIPHYLRKDNFSVLRLIIRNSENKVLMVGGKDWWGMPWVNFTKRQFINEAIDSLATEYGIELMDVELRGQFCFKYDYKPTVTFRNYYTALVKSGKAKIPSNTIEDEFEKVEWVEMSEAIKRIGNKGMQAITTQLVEYPNSVWGASFMVSHTDDDHPTKLVEDFYPLFER